MKLLISILFYGLIGHASTFDNREISCDEGEEFAVCEFRAVPGKNRVFITDITIEGSCHNMVAYRFYYSTKSFDDAINSDNFVDFQMNQDCESNEDFIIEGLKNGQTYFFRSGLIGLDGKLAGVNSRASIEKNKACAAGNDKGCNMIATPRARE